MNSDKIKLFCEAIAPNFLKENESSQMAPIAPLILPLLTKLYNESIIPQIADVQPLTAPVGKVAALYTVYSGSGSSAETHTHPDSSFILILPNVAPATTWTPDVTTVTFSGSDFMTRYVEEDKDVSGNAIVKILVSRESGTAIPKAGDTFNTRVITYATTNRAAVKKLFRGYAGAVLVDGLGNKQYIGYNYGYDDPAIRFIGFETRTVDVTVLSRKLRSKLSQEQIQDMAAVYKLKGLDTFTDAISNEMRQEIDKEFINYIKYISKLLTTTNSPLALQNSYGASPSGSLQDVSYDLVSNIYLAAEQIVKDTKRNRTIFVLADPVTTAFLQTNAFHVTADTEEKNPYKVGKIGTYPLFCDLYAEQNEFYILVGYMGVDGEGDAGVIYSPYTTALVTVTDKDLKENTLYLERYGITRHPQDSGNIAPTTPWDLANSGNSDFFKIFTIDYTNVKNFGDISVPNFK